MRFISVPARRRVVAMGCLLLLASGCTAGGASERPSPPPARTAPRPVAPGTTRLDRGLAHLEVRGDFRGSFQPSVHSGYVNAEATAVTWGEAGDPAQFSVAMPAVVGRPLRTREDRTTLQIAVGGVAGDFFNSEDGECTITLARADRDGMAGHFTCRTLHDPSGTRSIRASGSFSANP